MIRRPSGLNARLRSGRSRLPGSGKRNSSSPVAAFTDDQVRGVARGDPAAVGAEGHAPEAAGDVSMGEDLLASATSRTTRSPFRAGSSRLERPRHGGDPRAVGAERHAVERLPGLAKGAQIEVTLAPGVIPLPAPEILGAAVEQLQGPGDVVAEALAECEVDAADVVLPPQLFGPSSRIERSAIRLDRRSVRPGSFSRSGVARGGSRRWRSPGRRRP